jgi:transposase
VRIGRRVRQETVAVLGELDADGRAKAKALAEGLGVRPVQQGLFAPALPTKPVAVYLDRVELQRGREFGDVWLGLTLWQTLKLDEFFARHLGETGREEVPWDRMAAILVISRLCAPSSELRVAEAWYRGTALEDLLGVSPEKVNEDRLLRTLDRLAPLKADVEKHLQARVGSLFSVPYELMLYDLTATYFEGQALANPLAQRGHSPDHRPDCKQVCLALVVTKEGLPLGYEVFAGNESGVKTVETMVTEMEKRYGRADRIWVMDRGMVSEKNLSWLRRENRRFLVGTPKSDLRRFETALSEPEGWQEVREGLRVKLCLGAAGKDTYVLCRSEDRREKEKAMHDRFSARILERLERLKRRLERARKPVDKEQVQRQLGRLFARNSRAAKKFLVRVEERPERKGGLAVSWSEQAEWAFWAELTEGAYLLRTNIREWTPEELWRTYILLGDAEAAFRAQKSDLAIRPVWHQKAHRVQAHILASFLAYVLWKTLEQWQQRAGLGNSPRTILRELGRIQSADVILPTVDGRELKLRCVVRPEKAQADLLGRLGLDLPRRLQPPQHRLKM